MALERCKPDATCRARSSPALRVTGSGIAQDAWTLLLQYTDATGIFNSREDMSIQECPMLETTVKLDHDAIMREARALRAKAMADLMRSIISFFRRKPYGNAAKA